MSLNLFRNAVIMEMYVTYVIRARVPQHRHNHILSKPDIYNTHKRSIIGSTLIPKHLRPMLIVIKWRQLAQ